MWDPEKKKLINIPDNQARLAALTLELAYREGRPLERQISATADFEDLQALLEAMRQSPAGRASLERDSLQKTVEGKEIPPVLPDAAREEEVQAT